MRGHLPRWRLSIAVGDERDAPPGRLLWAVRGIGTGIGCGRACHRGQRLQAVRHRLAEVVQGFTEVLVPDAVNQQNRGVVPATRTVQGALGVPGSIPQQGPLFVRGQGTALHQLAIHDAPFLHCTSVFSADKSARLWVLKHVQAVATHLNRPLPHGFLEGGHRGARGA